MNAFAEEGQCLRLQATVLVMGAAADAREEHVAELQRSVLALYHRVVRGGYHPTGSLRIRNRAAWLQVEQSKNLMESLPWSEGRVREIKLMKLPLLCCC